MTVKKKTSGDENAAPKRRGRPPGSGNKKKTASTTGAQVPVKTRSVQPEKAPWEDKAELLKSWITAREELQTIAKPLQVTERSLREKVVELFFTDSAEGTHEVTLPSEWRLKLTKKFSYKVDETLLDSACSTLPEGSVDWLVNWKPSLNLANYRTLPENLREAFNEAVTVKEESPQLDLLEPKPDA